MASVSVGDDKIEVEDNSKIRDACEALGIPFSCNEGICGSCLIDVTEGSENLGELNDKEKAYGLKDKGRRLACQCKINSGDIKVESGL